MSNPIDLMTTVDLARVIYPAYEKRQHRSEETGRLVVDAELQQIYRIAASPEAFGLPVEAVVRIGKQLRFRRDLVEDWIRSGGTPRKEPKNLEQPRAA